MDRIKSKFDTLILILCLVVFGFELFAPSGKLGLFWGAVGVIYCTVYLYISLFQPIKRDWILAKGHFLMKVINFVLFVPFVVLLVISVASIEGDESSPVERNVVVQSDGSYPEEQDLALVNSEEEKPSIFLRVYYHFINPGDHNNVNVPQMSRGRAVVIDILGFLLLNGLLISTLISWFERRRNQWMSGHIRYGTRTLKSRKFAIIIGANEAAPTIMKRLFDGCGEKRVNNVILLTNENVESVRERISSYLTENESKKVIIYNGQLDSIEEITYLRVNYATEIYLLGENSSNDVAHSYHDAQNMRCVHNIANYLEVHPPKGKIVCRVLFEYQTTYSVFQFSDLPDNIRKHLIFIPFNAYENWAQRVFVKGQYVEDGGRRVVNYMPLDGDGISPSSDKHVHLVVVGMSKMGIAIAIQAAQIAHYPNFSTGIKRNGINREPNYKRTRITFIDANADREMDFFKGRYQNLFDLARCRYIDASKQDYDSQTAWYNGGNYSDDKSNFIDIEWEFVKGGVESPGVISYLRDAAKDADVDNGGSSLLTIAVCHPMAHESMAAALYMPSEVYDFTQQILVYQREASDIVYNLSSENSDKLYKLNKRYVKLRPFGMQYADFTMDKDNFYRAQLCAYVYEVYENAVDIISKMDLSNREDVHTVKARDGWHRLPIHQKWSNRYLANSFETKLRSIGVQCGDDYSVIAKAISENRVAMDECEHNRWNVQQLLMGFRAYRDDELERYKVAQDKKRFKGEMKKGSERAHLNICPIDMLYENDQGATAYDMALNSSIPAILRCVENYKKVKC